MKVLLHSDMQKSIEKSGVGRAITHQKMALDSQGIQWTTNPRDPGIDLVHINTIFPQSLMKAWSARYHHLPVVFHAHSTEEDFRDSFKLANLMAPLFKGWIKSCYNSANLVLTPSDYAKGLLDHYQLKAPIEVVSNGIDLDFWQASDGEVAQFKSRYQKDPTRPLIISVGLPIKRKGIIDFVELARRLPQYDFVWFGYTDPKFLPRDVQKAYATKLPNLSFPGYIDRNQVRLAYQACDLYLFLTHEETEGIVLLEAFASKANTIIRDIPVFSDPIKDRVNVYKARDVDHFEELIIGRMTNQLAPLIHAGYHVAQARSIQAVGRQLADYYRQAIQLAQL